jgi:hypothetical protein
MPSDYYSEEPETAEPSAGREGKAGDEPERKEDDGAQTELVNSSLFGGDCKPGDRYTVEVVAVHDDQLEIKPVKEDENPMKPEERSTEGARDRMSRYADIP